MGLNTVVIGDFKGSKTTHIVQYVKETFGCPSTILEVDDSVFAVVACPGRHAPNTSQGAVRLDANLGDKYEGKLNVWIKPNPVLLHAASPEVLDKNPRLLASPDDADSWLRDPLCRDQYMVTTENTLQIFWANLTLEHELTASFSIDSCAEWSLTGRFLVLFRHEGLELCCGSKFEPVKFIPYRNPRSCLFSSHDKYVIVGDPHRSEAPVWMCVFRTEDAQEMGGAWIASNRPPSWSCDERFVAWQSDDGVHIVDVSESEVLQPLSVKKFAWSNARATLAVANFGQKQAGTVGLVEVPSMRPLVSRQVLDIHDVIVVWHPLLPLAYFSIRHKKVKKVTKMSSLFIVEDDRKKFPVTMVDLGENCLLFVAWSPTSPALAYVRGAKGSSNATLVVQDKGKTTSAEVTAMDTTHLINWSPNGMLIAWEFTAPQLGNAKSIRILYVPTMQVVADLSYPDLISANWDTIGATLFVSYFRVSCMLDVVDFQGRLVHTVTGRQRMMVAVRPRPQKAVSAETEADVQKNVDKYAAVLDQRDKEHWNKITSERHESRMKKLVAWCEWRAQCRARFLELQSSREKLYRDAISELKQHIPSYPNYILSWTKQTE